jgi:predicted RNA-binding Zn-ribbon protein involved in translation (DUF1610 family)
MSDGFICLTTDDQLRWTECANCTDGGVELRGEQWIVNAEGVKFCSPECADEYDTRVEHERARRATDWCPDCGFDSHEHNVDCPRFPEGLLRS